MSTISVAYPLYVPQIEAILDVLIEHAKKCKKKKLQYGVGYKGHKDLVDAYLDLCTLCKFSAYIGHKNEIDHNFYFKNFDKAISFCVQLKSALSRIENAIKIGQITVVD